MIDIEYIGKEANRWEEQFYLGAIPDAQIVYSGTPSNSKQTAEVLDRLKAAAVSRGLRRVAFQLDLDRGHLSRVLGGKRRLTEALASQITRFFADLDT